MNMQGKQSICQKNGKNFFITFKMPADDVNSRAGNHYGRRKKLMSGSTTSGSTKVEYVADIEGAEPQAVEPSDKLATTWAALKK